MLQVLRRVGFVLMAGVVALTALPGAAEAATTMKVTSGNLKTLVSYKAADYTGMYLEYTPGTRLVTSGYYKKESNISGKYRIGDGQCVAAVRALAADVHTGSWRKGAQVMRGGIAAGTVIATFNASGGTRYGGHVGILRGYVRNSSGALTGFVVTDQNWNWKYLVGTHPIYRTNKAGIDPGDAADYFVVTY